MMAGNLLEKSPALVEAILEFYSHPAWITDADGNLILNSSAQKLEAQGVHVANVRNKNGAVTICGRRYKLDRSEMNHGTDCYLCQLHEQDEATVRLKAMTDRLSNVLASR